MEKWVRFENIEIKRDGYYISYSPKFITSKHNDNTAILSVRFLEERTLKECKDIAETEYQYWIKRFPVPLQVLISFEFDTKKRMSDIVDCPYICGVSSSLYRWGGFLDNELTQAMPSNHKLKLIYGELACNTSLDADIELKQRVLGIRVIKWFLLITAVVIPALIAFLGWSHPFFSALALIFAWYKCADKWLSLSGRKIKTDREIELEKEEQLKEHHHYHCKLNPEGFEQLKLDNLRADRKNRLNNKLKSMESSELEN